MHPIKTPQIRAVHGGLPTWFRACCWEAARGGVDSYFNVGRQLAMKFGSEVPDDIEWDDWVDEVDKFDSLLCGKDDAAAWSWFRDHYPRFAKLIPPRRRSNFVAGMRHTRDEDGLEV